MSDPISTMIVETLAVHLASFPRQALDECDCSEELKRAVWLACDAFYAAVSEATVEVLQRELVNDVRRGLRELDEAK